MFTTVSSVSHAFVLSSVMEAVILLSLVGQSVGAETKATPTVAGGKVELAAEKKKSAEATSDKSNTAESQSKDPKSAARNPDGSKSIVGKPEPINLNKATEAQLSSVPGIGPTYAKKIIAGRPYRSIDDLSKAGVPTATISKVHSQVSLTDTPITRTAAKPIIPDTTPTLVDLNKATEAQLREVPGIGESIARKIMANRPYKSLDDLSKAGIPGATAAKIKSQLTVGGLSAAPAEGMVWVNLISRKYHKNGAKWYGKTKSGEYMTEADAIKAGYQAAKR